MTLLDLFSGIGGFSLAARWAGIETIQFVEIDPFCQKVLAKNFPGVPIHDDIKTFKAEPGSADIVSGGFPCQPFSCAGKRRGKEDDRYLWPEMRRVISEARPSWVIAENVTGIDGMALKTIISDMESIKYEVLEPLEIPACAVGSPQRRSRIWLVSHALCGIKAMGGAIRGSWRKPKQVPWDDLCQREGEPPMVGMADGVSCRVDRLKSLGNAIVPQIAHEIFEAIKEVECQ